MSDSVSHAEYVVVLVTVPDVAVGDRLARALLDERLVACVNQIGPLRSLFRWNGQIDAAEEHLLLLKTRVALFAEVRARIAALHPYAVPEIIALPIVAGAASYLDWIGAETRR